ncbi:alanyl-tRNA synthetase [Myroides odoratimimus CCUG 12901]|uniref:alanine--tRNA ligase n=1 Tax=Myroides odoratimimus TaxID=76832 RepID=UPI0002460DB9|nr:alanine--tRNA ligase [Myroides odoratimimus]EHO05594.1 alanyl-tRNA synthetase [Myroides odoratimimus CCUG 12901]MDM1507389.1 alanine--tRNA ligase [Myroides odoratimimus]MDM1510900.1 alanine--tRNA ligase [Myroides odoratimimus]MDM1517624.1 alanine--tRNA ligase [Myroides odoratimimus]MDM1527348.1 alanine--tRNA ligase [Myroides odoratimimus]
MKSQEIRQKFLNFFEERGHMVVPSAPIVLKDDPTLMFNNSGMAQFKEYFLGNAKPKSNRITDTQKCLRVSGKHNDLEEVGIDTYHHTMFEMLGNWSFGDYFKKEAINWAWELLTEVYKIPKDILYVTVFEGSEEENVPFDQEAYDIWSTLIDKDRILMGNKKDNFWEMGDQGPCGPCTEIHVDIRSAEEKAKIAGRELVNGDHPQVVEIWNNVFMEFNRKADGSLEKLPAQHVDTGMGFERLCMVLQGVQSNYDTDVFSPLIAKVSELTGGKYTMKAKDDEEEKINIAIRVIVDHVRAVAFAIADGQLPSNNGAGYVIRRILRRAIRYAFTFLDKKEPFIYELVEVLSAQMGAFFPEITSQKELVKNVIKEEETSFLRTLEQGLHLLDNVIKQTEGKVVSGVKAFELYDTFGFPIDLTALILREKGYELDEAGFDAAMLEQKTRSRAASEVSTDDWTVLVSGNVEQFVGYDQLENEVKITRYRKIDSKKDGKLFQIVLDATPFYPEGGGQVGDTGVLVSANDTIQVIDTKKENNLILHIVRELPANVEGILVAKVDVDARKQSMANHSATHLLHQALRTILGTHVEQKGSLVAPTHLRFDFSHFSKVTEEELAQVEAFVNDRIHDHLPLVERRSIPMAQAIAEGAMALFGEKYGDEVRAIKFGESMELCGGTHVGNTSDIWQFKIVSEGAVAAGIRRIEAITNKAARQFYAEQELTLKEIKMVLKNPQDTLKAVGALQDENAKLKKQVEQLLKEKAKNLKGDLKGQIQEVNGIAFLAVEVDLDASGAKDLAYELGNEFSNLYVLFGSVANDKPMLTCYVSKDIVESKGLNAGTIVRELGKHIQGGGGGQAFFATAGGKNPAGMAEAIAHAKDYLK